MTMMTMMTTMMTMMTMMSIVAFCLFPALEAFEVSHYNTKATLPLSFSVRRKEQGITCLFDKNKRNDDDNVNDNDDEVIMEEETVVEVGTKEYYTGFLSSPIQDETVAQRGNGLEQALKLGGGVLVVLVVLVAGFLASNDLI
jgi:hypothetical protein